MVSQKRQHKQEQAANGFTNQKISIYKHFSFCEKFHTKKEGAAELLFVHSCGDLPAACKTMTLSITGYEMRCRGSG